MVKLTDAQMDYIKDNYGGGVTMLEISIALNIELTKVANYIKQRTPTELNEQFKHFKRVKERDFYDPLEEPDMTPVESKVEIVGDKFIYSFQSRLNY